jgi:hypothetical protein
MATTNKSFKVKNGLIVEGTTGTINGANILTESQAGDDYILDLVGGVAYITSVSGNLNVTNEVLTINESGLATNLAGSYLDSNQGTLDVDFASIASDLVSISGFATETYVTTAIGNIDLTYYTDDVQEGQGATNLYFTDSRAVTAISNVLGNGIEYSGTFDVQIGDGLSFGGGVTGNGITVNLDGAGGLGFNQGTLGIDRTVVDGWYEDNGAVYDHNSLTTGVHGVNGDVVGTTDQQTLSNKTFSDNVTFSDGQTSAGTIGKTVDGKLLINSNETLALHSENSNIELNPGQGHHVYIGSASAENEVATHSYVDNAVSGLDWKNAVHLLYDAAIPVLSGSGASQLIIDGHDPLGDADSGYRVLITQSSDAGIYVFNSTSGNWTLTRAEDADAYGELVGAAVFVMEGTTYGGSSWVQANHYLTNFAGQDWTQFSGSGTVTAGTGILVNGLQVSVDTDVIATQFYADDAVGTHSDYTSNIHGVTGNVVGTTDQQTLTNKTIDASSNTISNIANSSLTHDSITVNGYATALGDTVTLDTNDVSEGGGVSPNLYFTNQRALDATASAYDAAGTAQGIVDNLTTADIEEFAPGGPLYFTDARAKDAAVALLTDTSTTLNNIEISYVPNVGLTITAENGVADSTTDDLDEGVNNLYFTDQKAVDAIAGSDIAPNTVTIDTYRKEEATQQYVQSASTVTVHELTAGFESAKYLVRVVGNVTGTRHSQLTEILLTTDGSGNIAITEYGNIHTSDDPLASFSASSGPNGAALTATTAVSGCEVIVAATMLSWAD